jgi:hypothetical protein
MLVESQDAGKTYNTTINIDGRNRIRHGRVRRPGPVLAGSMDPTSGPGPGAFLSPNISTMLQS